MDFFPLGSLYTGIFSAEHARKQGISFLFEFDESKSAKLPTNIEPVSSMSHQDNTSKFSMLFKDLGKQLLFTLLKVTAHSPLWKIQGLTVWNAALIMQNLSQGYDFFSTYFMTLFCLDIYVLVALSYSIYCQIASISYLLHSKLCVQGVWKETDKVWSW